MSDDSHPPSLAATAARLGGWRWIEMRLFAVAGGWVPTTGSPAAKRWLTAAARHHAWRADQWAERFPVVREFDLETATVAPPGWAAACDELAGLPADEARIGALVRVALPRLVVTHESVLDASSPVSDGAFRRTLRLVLVDESDDWRSGEGLLQPLLDTPGAVARASDAQARVEAALVAGGAGNG